MLNIFVGHLLDTLASCTFVFMTNLRVSNRGSTNSRIYRTLVLNIFNWNVDNLVKLIFSAVRGLDDANKPRIWSLADTATSNSPGLGRRSPSSMMVKNESDSPDSMSPSLDQFSRTMVAPPSYTSNGQYGGYSPTGSRYMDLNSRSQMYSTMQMSGLGQLNVTQNLSSMGSMSQALSPISHQQSMPQTTMNNNNNLGKGSYMNLGGMTTSPHQQYAQQHHRYSPSSRTGAGQLTNGFTNLHEQQKGT